MTPPPDEGPIPPGRPPLPIPIGPPGELPPPPLSEPPPVVIPPPPTPPPPTPPPEKPPPGRVPPPIFPPPPPVPPPPAPPPAPGGSPGPPIVDVAPTGPNYTFQRDALALLLLRSFFPERTNQESAVIRDFLVAHGEDFDRYQFSVRVGQGLAPDPTHLPAVQMNTAFSTRKRIDCLFWKGPQPFIIEVKLRVTPAALGQILTYRHLFLEEFPDAPDPELVVVGRFSDDDTLRALSAHGITVYLYEAFDALGPNAAGGV